MSKAHEFTETVPGQKGKKKTGTRKHWSHMRWKYVFFFWQKRQCLLLLFTCYDYSYLFSQLSRETSWEWTRLGRGYCSWPMRLTWKMGYRFGIPSWGSMSVVGNIPHWYEHKPKRFCFSFYVKCFHCFFLFGSLWKFCGSCRFHFHSYTVRFFFCFFFWLLKCTYVCEWVFWDLVNTSWSLSHCKFWPIRRLVSRTAAWMLSYTEIYWATHTHRNMYTYAHSHMCIHAYITK